MYMYSCKFTVMFSCSYSYSCYDNVLFMLHSHNVVILWNPTTLKPISSVRHKDKNTVFLQEMNVVASKEQRAVLGEHTHTHIHTHIHTHTHTHTHIHTHIHIIIYIHVHIH